MIFYEIKLYKANKKSSDHKYYHSLIVNTVKFVFNELNNLFNV